MRIRKHTEIRIRERCSLTVPEVCDLIESGKYYPIGRDASREHEHRIIYSPKDDKLFVLVQDYDNDEAITLLPAEYDRGCKIAPDTIELAKQCLIENYGEDIKEKIAKNIADAAKPPKGAQKITVVANVSIPIATYKTSDGQVVVGKKSRSIRLGNIRIEELIGCGFPSQWDLDIDSITECLDDASFRQNVSKAIAKMRDQSAIARMPDNLAKMISVTYIISTKGGATRPMSLPCP